MAKTAAEILAELNSHFIGPSTGPIKDYTPAGYGDWAYSVNPKGKGGGSSSSGGKPIWQKALETLNAPGATLTNMMDEGLRQGKDLGWKMFNPFSSDYWHAAGNIWSAGADGFTGKDQRGFETFLKDAGVKNESALRWGGLAGDIVLDPTNLLTFGAGSAIKLGTRAATEAAAKAAVNYGVKGSKLAEHVPYQVFDKVKSDMVAKGIAQPLAERFATKKMKEVQDVIDAARKTARAGGQNALLNFDMPFTKMATPIGKKPGFLTKVDPKIGSVAVPQVIEMLGKLGAHTPTEQADILSRMGIDIGGSFDNMGTQQFRHLQDQVDLHSPKNVANNGQVKANLSGQTPPVTHTKYQQTTSFPGMFQVGNPITKTTAKTTSQAATPHMPDFNQFVQDMGGRSKLGDKVGKVTDMFNPRTLGIAGQGVVNGAASTMREAEGMIYAGMRNTDKIVAGLKKETKDFTEQDMQHVEYLLENDYPAGFNQATITQAQKDVAAKLRPMYKEIADAESKAGILQAVNKNYAPHVINHDPALLQRAAQYPTDPDFQKLVGKSSRNQFSKQRTSFQSFAELDNAIAKLDRAKKQPGLTPDQIAEIDDKMDILSKLFNRDPIDALGKRYAKSIKSRAMKQLQDQLMKDGLLKAGKNFANSPQAGAVAGDFVVLGQAEAAALNLKPGMRMHKDVLDALKKVDEIFTVKGMNKVVQTLENVTSIWKSLVTNYIPSHYWNNFVGNVFNNMLAGVKPGSYNDARKLMKAIKQGKATPAQQKLYQTALENGVLNQGFMSDFIELKAKDGPLGDAAHFMYNNKVAKKIRNTVGDPSENFTRLALFLHSKNTLGSTKLAAGNVRKYLFNYHEATGADRTMRVFIPFWNWMKNNVPLQIEQLMQQPRFYSTYMKIKNENQEGSGEMPGFAQDAYFKFPGLGENGQARDPMLPLNDLNGVLNNPQEALRYVAGSTNPFMKMLYEIPTNTNVYTGRPIDYQQKYEGQTDPSAWAKYGLSQLGKTGRTVYDATSGDASLVDAISNLFSPLGKPVPLK